MELLREISTKGPATQAEYPDPDWGDKVCHWEGTEEAATELVVEGAEKEVVKEEEAVAMEVEKAKG
eukprot:13003261-Ditylum_brightwellii.AAC.1